ncbi:MAG TPA: hypothetical protein VE869_04995 [Gemmatimonas sp.]|nr:hypothetical protein [Gemmatimonas sp.]
MPMLTAHKPTFNQTSRLPSMVPSSALLLALLAMVPAGRAGAQGTPPDSSRTAVAAQVAAKPVDPRLAKLKAEALVMVEARSKQVQEIVDMLFSFQELGFQEFETQKYLTTLLQKEGFKIEKGVAGIPSSWTAKWSNGSGKPEIALGSDVDGIPQASNKPGVG